MRRVRYAEAFDDHPGCSAEQTEAIRKLAEQPYPGGVNPNIHVRPAELGQNIIVLTGFHKYGSDVEGYIVRPDGTTIPGRFEIEEVMA